MSDYTRLSIWENNSHKLSWYDHVIGRTIPTEPFVTPSSETNIVDGDEPIWMSESGMQGLSYQDDWFNELKSQDQRKDRIAAKQLVTNELIESAMINHYARESQPQPYFEYMFADAGFVVQHGSSNQNSIDELSTDKGEEDQTLMCPDFDSMDAASPPEWQPGTPEPEMNVPDLIEVSHLGLEELRTTNVQRVTRGIASMEFMATDAIPPADYATVEMQPVSENTQANINFFGVGPFPDSYNVSHLQSLYTFEGPKLFSFEQSLDSSRRMLKPISPREKIQARSQQAWNDTFFAHETDAAKDLAFFPVSQVTHKRSASELEEDHDEDQDDVVYLYTKKARLSVKEVEIHGNRTDSVKSVDCISISDDTSSSRQTSTDFFNHKPLAVAPKGYAGQFDGMIVKKNMIADFKFNISHFDIMKSGIHFTFGDPRHPNGVYTHVSFTADPLSHTTDFTKENLPSSHPLVTCMNFAADMTTAAAHSNVVTLRSHDEEILRREAHIECAHARLEGVSVGYYRYYQGHLSVEEYHEAEMCIC